MSQRAERVGERIQAELARLLREEVRDPRIGFVTVTGVSLSPDLKNARIWISVLGSDPDESVQALNRAASFLRRRLARDAGLRFTPQLQFAFDASVEGGQRVESILADLHDAGESLEPGSEDES